MQRTLIALGVLTLTWVTGAVAADSFTSDVLPILEKHCIGCHGGETTKGDVDFSQLLTYADAENHPELWEAVIIVIKDEEMPPEDEPPLPEPKRRGLLDWVENDFFGEIESKPAPFRPRRLSAPEYRNTLRSLFGFDLEISIAEAEQNVTDKSLVLKLLPTDPPGDSGFINDTRRAPLTTQLWDQYSYLADSALNRYFADRTDITADEAEALVREFVPRAFRRPVEEELLAPMLARLEGKTGRKLVSAVKFELKAVLMSPAFLYRGQLAMPDPASDMSRQKVDAFELAERLSYFLWEDMPDEELAHAAASGDLSDPAMLRAEVDRLIDSPKSRRLADSFASQWLLLDQIDHRNSEAVYRHALQNQPIEFVHYLISEDRPVIELIDSEVTFFNANLAEYYGSDSKLLEAVEKRRGIEKVVLPLQKVALDASAEDRGAGILTMPGVLGMNEGPILRGTWMLRRILGEHLGEPPPDVPPIEAVPTGKKVTFRERFEVHRSDKSCALCHDKIDPLGFALEGYDEFGGVVGKQQSRKKKKNPNPISEMPDTSGQLPGGQTFADFKELREILLTTERERIVRNVVEQMLAYALCRKLERSDRPTVEELTAQIVQNNGTWRDLIYGIAQSVPFTETNFEEEL